MTTGERAQTLGGFGESTAVKRSAPTHPLAGKVAKGRGTSYPQGASFATSTGRIELAQPRASGVVGGVLMVMAAVVLLLWVLGFGLSFIATLIMRGS